MAKNSQASSLILVALLLLGSLYFFTSYSVTHVTTAVQAEKDQDVKLRGVQADVATLNRAKIDLASAKSALEAYGVSFAQINSHMPLSERLPDLYRQMQSTLASYPTLQATTYQIGSPTLDAAASIVKIPFTLSATGSYTDLRALLRSLQNDTRPLSVTQLGFSYVSDEKDSAHYTMSLTGFFAAIGLSSSFSTTK